MSVSGTKKITVTHGWLADGQHHLSEATVAQTMVLYCRVISEARTETRARKGFGRRTENHQHKAGASGPWGHSGNASIRTQKPGEKASSHQCCTQMGTGHTIHIPKTTGGAAGTPRCEGTAASGSRGAGAGVTRPRQGAGSDESPPRQGHDNIPAPPASQN